jgi:demethylmenaquinone methyltransferase/2-methoxy-6-polyprenyl-1,4-benzoquinol methylase
MSRGTKGEIGQQQVAIRQLFTSIARRYDLVNRLLSLGQDQRWRRQALAAAELPPGGSLLDVATGTGDVAWRAVRQEPARHVVGLDLTPAMLRYARTKGAPGAVSWTLGDGLALPFPESTFDAVISVFMLRNVPDVPGALAEQRRVVRPGGRVVCLEMTWPRRFPISWLFDLYFFGWAPLVGWLLTGDARAYRYLPRSVKRFMRPEALAEALERAGLRIRERQSLMLGTVTLLSGVRE